MPRPATAAAQRFRAGRYLPQPEPAKLDTAAVRPPTAIGGRLMADSFGDATERLFAEFGGQIPLLRIVTIMRECAEQLRGSPPAALPELAERLARVRLGTDGTGAGGR